MGGPCHTKPGKLDYPGLTRMNQGARSSEERKLWPNTKALHAARDLVCTECDSATTCTLHGYNDMRLNAKRFGSEPPPPTWSPPSESVVRWPPCDSWKPAKPAFIVESP